MKKMAILASLILMSAASAQEVQAPPVDGIPKKCTITTVQTKSVATPSPQMQALLSKLHPAGYNNTQPNHNFGDSFRVCLCEICTAKLEIRVAHTTPIDLATNDGYDVGIAPFGNGGQGVLIANGNVWPAGGSNAEKTITINLNTQQLA